MKSFRYIALLLVSCLTLSVWAEETEEKGGSEFAWSSKQSSRTGLYSTRNYFITNGVSLSVHAMYYFGDVDNVGVAFNGGFNKYNLSYGGALSFQYLLPLSHHCNMRFSLGAGKLNGNNAYIISQNIDSLGNRRNDYRKFDSWFIQPAVGVEIYPFEKAGFYLYGGIALTASHINAEKGTITFENDGETIKELVPQQDRAGNVLFPITTWSFLPMAQLGIGYSIRLNKSWTLNIEAMGQLGLCDLPRMNLDAWPLPDTEASGYSHNKSPDGWFQLGVTVTYRWRNCEHCRLNKNTRGHRGARSARR
ncbi:MAG: hypothetical protein IJS82_04830 [Paludibacteraceae bacterium]|nr:hypothetical protein [Paludibacteraceae bacterium]